MTIGKILFATYFFTLERIYIMTRNTKKQKNALPIFIFIAIEILLYLVYMYMDIMLASGNISANSTLAAVIGSGVLSPTYIKYYSIILCLLISVIYYYKNKSDDSINAYTLLAAAMFFTAISDYFLLLKNDVIVPGLISFCIVHAIYLFVITCKDIKMTGIYTGIRVLAAIIIAVILKSTGVIRYSNDSSLNSILFLVLLYGISFVWNVGLLFLKLVNNRELLKSVSAQNKINNQKDIEAKICTFPHPRMFLIGLILFLLCDINVLLFNLSAYINVSSEMYAVLQIASTVLMWAFYLPSQVLIVLSVLL